MSRTRMCFRKSLLASATALCLAALSSPVLAQGATGAVAGRAEAGTQVTITNPDTGFTRSVTVGSDGSYRISQLPPGDYRLQVSRGGAPVGEALSVSVPLGGTANVNLGSDGGVTNIGGVTVVGGNVVNRVDVRSVETATNITREELLRQPVDQTLGSVALLAPGVVGGNSSFGGISFGGSSVAENSVFINGLNVTDFYRRQSWSAAPFAFYREFQVKTGGYSVEFGRSTGGVINAVSRSGSNEVHAGVEVTFEPASWKSPADDRFYEDGSLNVRSSRDRSALTKTNVWASGPLVKDRVFLFAMYEQRAGNSRYTNAGGTSWSLNRGDNGFWGAKLDWNISDNHLLELLAFSDESDSLTRNYAYNWTTETIGAAGAQSTSLGGGQSGSVTYTGHFGDNFTAKAMYGLNRSQSKSVSPADAPCDWVTYNNASYGAVYRALPLQTLGCHPGASVINHEDERKVGRLDFEWTLGDHMLRFGLDREVMTTDRTSFYPGGGIQYTAYGRTSASQVLDNGTALPTGVNAFLMGRRRADGGLFETTANAWYIEDNWSVTPNFLLNLGVRVDAFNNKTAAGTSFIKMDKLLSPRLGFSWDLAGDGSMKLFGNLGRYYLPVTNNINYTFAGGLTDERTFYVLNGWTQQSNPVTGAPYLAPIIGPQIGPVDTQYNVSVADLRQSVDADPDAVYQDELILGFQQALSQAWSWGVNATYRRMENALDDVRINHTPCGPTSTLWPIANPGKPLTIWGTKAMGCAQDGWITIDTSVDGYRKGGSGEVIGYFEPKREYKSVEFQIDRAWDRKWAFNASYLWSRSTGNHEGPVNSDTNYGDTGMVQHWDHPANNERYGVLFNDHTHQIKLRGTYALNDNWAFGASLRASSGGPITAFGVTWPNDTISAGSFTTIGSGGGSGWLCVQNCSGAYNTRVYEFSPRGAFGRLPWTYNLGANVTWTMPLATTTLRAKFSVFNLLNQQEVLNVSARYEGNPGVMRSTFGTATRWQSPRYAQLVLSWEF